MAAEDCIHGSHSSTGGLAVFASDSSGQAALAGMGGPPSVQHRHQVAAHLLMLRLLLLGQVWRLLLHARLLLRKLPHVPLLLLQRLLASKHPSEAAASAG